MEQRSCASCNKKACCGAKGGEGCVFFEQDLSGLPDEIIEKDREINNDPE